MSAIRLPLAEQTQLFQQLLERFPFDLEQSATPDLLPAYSHERRSYHDMRHIEDLLNMMQQYLIDTGQDERAPWNLADRLIKAIWIHDMVQDDSGESEAKSYELAHAQLQQHWPEDALKRLRKEVRPLVMATAHFSQPADMSEAEQVMADIDLTPLGVPHDEFMANSEKVRAEFEHVPEGVYAAARANILGLFLSRSRIYYTDWFYERYETRARANLRAEAQRLESIANNYG